MKYAAFYQGRAMSTFRVISSESIGPSIWKYTVVENITRIETAGDPARPDPEGDFSYNPDAEIEAFNVNEVGNTEDERFGIPADRIPDGFEWDPVPDGRIVFGQILPANPWQVRFSWPNQLNGECSE